MSCELESKFFLPNLALYYIKITKVYQRIFDYIGFNKYQFSNYQKMLILLFQVIETITTKQIEN